MFSIQNGVIRLSVRSFVEFMLRSGDIDNRYAGAAEKDAMLAGGKLHRKIQKRQGSDYRAEVPLKYIMEKEHYSILLEGRADGIIDNGSGVTIDEIKGMYADVMTMEEPVKVHLAQAKCYAYMYALENALETISVQMTYGNLDTEQINYFRYSYTFEELEQWFMEVLTDFYQWCDFVYDNEKVRNESIKKLEFPFEYRKGQRDLVVGVYRTISRGKRLFIQAPTGVGKTVSTIFPAVKAVGEGLAQKVFYVTAKTITRTVAEDTFSLLRDKGLQYKTITITAKEKICPMEQCECNPQACEYALGHFDRVNEAVYDIVTSEDYIGRDTVLQYAKKHNVCPFEMSLDISYWCDGIICDYNYVFDPNVYLRRFFEKGGKGEYVFLIDEAHNLLDRARTMYSASMVKEEIMQVKRLVKNVDIRLTNALESANKAMLSYKRECDECEVYESVAPLHMAMLRVYDEILRFNEEHKGFEEKETVTDFFFKVRDFINIYELLDDKYIIYGDYTKDGEFRVNLFCVNPSTNLGICMDKGISTILFSATLLPIHYYKELLSGNEEDYAIYAQSPFDTKKRGLFIGKDITTKYTARTYSEYVKTADYIFHVTNGKAGNYMVFFPSYKYMRDVYDVIDETLLEENEVILQKNNMTEKEKEEFLEAFSVTDREKSLIGFCVMGGIFSEGIDLKNDSLIGAIIVGTGLPQVCNERELLRKYFDSHNHDGYNYAYVYPGMNKVLQAAGRVIRTEEDRGVVVLLDRRFFNSEYVRMYPREWDEIIEVEKENVEGHIKRFWD